MVSTLRLALALTLLAGASTASASDEHPLGLDLSLHGGLDQYDAVGLRSGLSTLDLSSSQKLKDLSQHVGLTAVLRLGGLELGAIGELGRPGKSNTTTVLGALAGMGFDVGSLRLEGLAELGGHRYGDALKDSQIISQSTRDVWLAYLGIRPGLSYRPADSHWLIGVWGFARWDLTSKNVQVTLADTSASSYKVGGSQYGAGLRLGFSL